jgi:hypothetical protein
MTPAAFQPSDTWDRPQVQSICQHGGLAQRGQEIQRKCVQSSSKSRDQQAKTLTVEECTTGAAACHKLIKEKTSKASHLRREHVHNSNELALDLKNPAKCIKIKEIIKRKEQQDEWRRIKQATGDPRTGATNLVCVCVSWSPVKGVQVVKHAIPIANSCPH